MFLAIVNLEEFNHTWQFWKQYIGEEQPDSDMEFVQKFTLPDFKVKNLTPSISPYFNSFSGKKHKK